MTETAVMNQCANSEFLLNLFIFIFLELFCSIDFFCVDTFDFCVQRSDVFKGFFAYIIMLSRQNLIT